MANKNSNHQSSLKGKLKNNLNPAPSRKKTYAFVEFPCGLDEPHEPHTTHRSPDGRHLRYLPTWLPGGTPSRRPAAFRPPGRRGRWGKPWETFFWSRKNSELFLFGGCNTYDRVFPKIRGFSPSNHPIFSIGVSIIFTIHFGVPLFLETSIYDRVNDITCGFALLLLMLVLKHDCLNYLI